VKVETLKNISDPIRIYKVRTEGSVRAEASTKPGKGSVLSHKSRAALIAGIIIILGLLGYIFYQGPLQTEPKSAGQIASGKNRTIAVLPVKNMSEDVNLQHFCDGILETIVTQLTRNRRLLVSSRTSVEKYRNGLQSSPEIGAELGVKYLLETSVFESGDKIRVSAQLIEAEKDLHIWSNQYDKVLGNELAVMSELAEVIASEVRYVIMVQLEKFKGWFRAGSEPYKYSMGIDQTVFKSGQKSAFIQSLRKVDDGFGTFMQTCSASECVGRTIQMTAYIKSQNVTDWAGMWLRVDSKDHETVGFDNMQDRPIVGTRDWEQYEIVMDVPEQSATLNFGVLMSGEGKVWFDDFTFEIVGEKDPLLSKLNSPLNPDFEE